MRIEVIAKDANNVVLGQYAARQPRAQWINVHVVAPAVRIEVDVRDDFTNLLGRFVVVQTNLKPVNIHAFILSTGAVVVSDDQENTYNKV